MSSVAVITIKPNYYLEHVPGGGDGGVDREGALQTPDGTEVVAALHLPARTVRVCTYKESEVKSIEVTCIKLVYDTQQSVVRTAVVPVSVLG